MDSAWVGVVGGAIGVAGTLLGTIFTQWRGEKQRHEDRIQELKRLQLQERLEREAARQSHWDELRRDIYRRFVAVSFRWRTRLVELEATARALDKAEAKSLNDEWVRGRREKLLAQLDSPEMDSFYDTVEDLIVELALIASSGVRNRAFAMQTSYGRARRLLRDGAYDEVEGLISTEAYAVMLEFMRVELGIEDPSILDKMAATPRQRGKAEASAER
ncbi:hypothetical protein ACFWE5_03910 [Cellulosimicrobium funkei]|uniref:hypothetical protein n=1 Tax=Cellulosimicrobium funkei TaxID=264251 RepID=UPI00366902A2